MVVKKQSRHKNWQQILSSVELEIQPVKIQVLLKDNSEVKSVKFFEEVDSATFCFCLTAGLLAHINVNVLVPGLAAEDVLFGLPLLNHIGVDTKEILKKNRDNLDGAGCSDIKTNESDGVMGKVGCLTIAKLNRVYGDEPKKVLETMIDLELTTSK